MITAGDVRPGQTVERNGALCQIVEFQHVKQGRGTAFVRIKLKNMETGSVTEETFRPEERFERARIERAEMQYLYKDGESYIVMDTTTYDQVPLSKEQLGDALLFLRENENFTVLQYDGRVIGVDLPITAELLVTQTDPGFRGDTANAGTKPATLETGLVVDVPLFVNQGDRVKVDTRTSRYIERV